MSEWVRWWLMIELVALLALPLCLVTFGRLADRGYTLSKVFGLLVVAYVFWLLNIVHLAPNSRGGIVGTLLLVGALSGAMAWFRRDELRAWFAKHWIYVVAVEIAFLYVFAMAVWLRSLVGQIQNTEQPMDLMFLNAMTQADRFPPQDPWLSGENVAYYYFGYFIVAMVGQLAGVPTQIGYNIGLGMIAALTLLGAFGVVYNLIKLRESAPREGDDLLVAPPAGGSTEADAIPEEEPQVIRRRRPSAAPVAEASAAAVSFADFNWRPYVFAIAGALMLVVMGNFVWLFKFASAYGIGGDGFYDWLDVDGLSGDEPRFGRWYPAEFFGYFGATRIYPINGEGFRAITEFPMFSFLLGDLHPHVMSLPFMLLALALALTLFMSDEPLDIAFWLKRPLLLAASAVMLGGLAFINTWDVVTFGFVIGLIALIRNWLLRPETPEVMAKRPLDSADAQLLAIIAAVVVGAVIVLVATLTPSLLASLALIGGAIAFVALFAVYLTRTAWSAPIETTVRTVSFAVPLVLLAACAFVPFYDGFSSQANGIYPVVTRAGVTVPGTRPLHAILYWGPLFVVFIPFVVARLLAQRERMTRRRAIVAAALPLAILAGWGALLIAQQAFDVSKISGSGNILEQVLDRGVAWITALALGAILSASALALWLDVTAEDANGRKAVIFAQALGVTAFLLVFGCEFFYVGDLFNVRMNTVFKLYYQAWLLLAVAGGFALYELAGDWRFSFPRANAYRYAWGGACAFAFIAAALYPLGASMNRIRPYNEAGLIEELHGLDGLSRYAPDELAAIAWLKEVGEGQKVVIAEAAKESDGRTDYGAASRISGASGVPTVLGWPGHEDQWRGSSAARAGRFEDLNAIYEATDMTQVEQIVKKYGITYIYVGQLERSTYGEAAMTKFEELPVAFTTGNVTVYRAPGTGGGVEAARAQ